jgi:hypothetical protein
MLVLSCMNEAWSHVLGALGVQTVASFAGCVPLTKE